MGRGRTIKKKTRTVKQTLLIYITGSLLCVYFGYLCGAVWMPGNDFNEFMNAFYDFIIIKHNFLVGITAATPVFILSYWVSFSLVILLIFTKIEHPFAGEEYGVAKWGDAKSFTREYANHDPKYEVEVNTGSDYFKGPVKVNTGNYCLAEGVYLSVFNDKTTNVNILVVGPSGSGKTFRIVVPNLGQLCGNYILTDCKGVVYKRGGKYFEDNGYEVMVMNVESEESMAESIHFNPFEYIRNESGIMSIAGILMKATTPQDEAGGGNDQFFEQSAEVLLTSLIYLIHYYYPKDEQNWRTFVKLLDATTVYTKADGSIDNRPGGIMDIMNKAQAEWKVNHDTDFPGYVAVDKFYNGAAETTSSIVASLDAHCRYMKLPCVIDLLSEDEIHIKESFGYSKPSPESPTGKRILFIVTSEDKRYYDWIPSMVYSLFFDELYHLTAIDPGLHEALPQHLTFLMDEFANVTLPDSFVEKLSTMRSRNMSAFIIVQNLIQLKRKFPKYDMDKDLIGNCGVIHILGAPDMDSCEYLSKHFGTQTIHKASDSDAKDHKGQSSRSEDVMQKPLLSAEDIFAMKKDGECAIMVKGADPLFEPKFKTEDSPFVKLLCRKTPYDPRIKLFEKREKKGKNECFLLAGEAARKEAERLKMQGVSIIRLTMDDIEKLALATKSEQEIKNLPPTKEQKEQMEKNYQAYVEKQADKAPIDFSQYVKKGEDPKKYQARVKNVQILVARKYTRSQLRALYPLLMENYTADMITELFPIETSIDEIKNFVEVLRKDF